MNFLTPILAFVLVAVPGIALAQEFIPLTSIPGVADAANSQNFAGLVNTLYRIAIGVAAALAVIQIIRGGITYMLGDTSIVEKREATHHIQLAIFGLLLVLSPAIVFGIIDARILDIDLNVRGLAPQPPIQREYPGDSTNDQTLTPDERTCTSYESFAYAVVPENGSCREVKGEGWVGLAQVCCGGRREGETCCGFDQDAVRPPPPVGTSGDFFYAYVSIIDMGTPSACVEDGLMQFESLALCQQSEGVARSQSNTALSELCDGTVVNPPQPVAVWNASQELDQCE